MDVRKVFREKDWKNTPEFAAAVSAVVYGLLVHGFALNNILHNHDNIASQPGGYGSGVPLGRWFLEILGLMFDKAGLNYNLPSVNGMIYIVLLAVAAALLVSNDAVYYDENGEYVTPNEIMGILLMHLIKNKK